MIESDIVSGEVDPFICYGKGHRVHEAIVTHYTHWVLVPELRYTLSLFEKDYDPGISAFVICYDSSNKTLSHHVFTQSECIGVAGLMANGVHRHEAAALVKHGHCRAEPDPNSGAVDVPAGWDPFDIVYFPSGLTWKLSARRELIEGRLARPDDILDFSVVGFTRKPTGQIVVSGSAGLNDLKVWSLRAHSRGSGAAS